MGRRMTSALAALATASLAVACSEKIAQPQRLDETPQTVDRKAAAADGGAEGGTPAVSFQEADFTENDRSRDPFRSYASAFADEAKSRSHGSEKPVVLRQYSLDELKLIGIVTRVHPAVAMLVDPTGKGYVVRRGQFVGRPDVVQGPGASSASYEVNWRIDSIRPTDIVLVREDPANPDVPTATRVIPLRPANEAASTAEGAPATLDGAAGAPGARP